MQYGACRTRREVVGEAGAPVTTANSLQTPAADELLSSYGIDPSILARAQHPQTTRVLPGQAGGCGLLKGAFSPCLLALSALRVLCCSTKPRHPAAAWGKMVSHSSVRV